jgi:hypothetical protein
MPQPAFPDRSSGAAFSVTSIAVVPFRLTIKWEPTACRPTAIHCPTIFPGGLALPSVVLTLPTLLYLVKDNAVEES